MNLYSATIPVFATVYVKAQNEDEALSKIKELGNLTIGLDNRPESEITVSSRQFNDPALPDISLSSVATTAENMDGVQINDHERDIPDFGAMRESATKAGWAFGGDGPGFWFHISTWGGWKNALSWSGSLNEPTGPEARPRLYDTLAELIAGEGLVVAGPLAAV